MGKVRVEMNQLGMTELLKSQTIADCVEGYAKEIAAHANASFSHGEGYAHDVKQLDTRVVASAYTKTPVAMRSNIKHNTLLKAMGEVQQHD